MSKYAFLAALSVVSAVLVSCNNLNVPPVKVRAKSPYTGGVYEYDSESKTLDIVELPKIDGIELIPSKSAK